MLAHSPRIVTDGLVLCLDAGNNKSYPGSGTAWTSLVGSGIATLTNGPTYSSNNGGYIVFDGVNDYVDCGTSSDYTFGTGAFTAEMWIYPTVTPSQFDCILIGDNPDLTSVFWGYRSGYLDFVNRGDTYTLIRMTYPTLNQWTHVVISRDSSGYIAAYKNGVVQASSTGNTDNYNQTEMYVGGQGSYTYPGYISNLRIYKGKGLTAEEIQQNYNALKGRYTT